MAFLKVFGMNLTTTKVGGGLDYSSSSSFDNFTSSFGSFLSLSLFDSINN